MEWNKKPNTQQFSIDYPVEVGRSAESESTAIIGAIYWIFKGVRRIL
ncbi:hypothetical protein AA106556_2094 [Neokomagataea tanensis NBRC 106556]|uniref:Transposase n=1 Tax=Neokomagataea tanensis NBRC 106556 TaxID=1223519 RepID=A0ABQ0QLQ8_9PROT|nr:hypothetical protein AA106556_2094 [Neokomagataea tanensis NBRC 106556]